MQPVQKATRSYKGVTIHMMSYRNGTNENRGATEQEIIWYQVYSGSIDGTSAIGYSLFVWNTTEGYGRHMQPMIECSMWPKYCQVWNSMKFSKMKSIYHFLLGLTVSL